MKLGLKIQKTLRNLLGIEEDFTKTAEVIKHLSGRQDYLQRTISNTRKELFPRVVSLEQTVKDGIPDGLIEALLESYEDRLKEHISATTKTLRSENLWLNESMKDEFLSQVETYIRSHTHG
jgi:uncharacterized membrane-anchored protein YhcB (DUF1043 family)